MIIKMIWILPPNYRNENSDKGVALESPSIALTGQHHETTGSVPLTNSSEWTEGQDVLLIP